MKIKQILHFSWSICVFKQGVHQLTRIRDALRQQQGRTGSCLVKNSLAANITKREEISLRPESQNQKHVATERLGASIHQYRSGQYIQNFQRPSHVVHRLTNSSVPDLQCSHSSQRSAISLEILPWSESCLDPFITKV